MRRSTLIFSLFIGLVCLADYCDAAGIIFGRRAAVRTVPEYRCGPDGCYPIVQPNPPARVVPAVIQPAADQGGAGNLAAPNVTPLGGVDRSNGVGSKNSLKVGNVVAPPSPQSAAPAALPEDAGKGFVVVVGSESVQNRVRAILAGAELGEALHVVYYSPDAWQAKRVGYEPGIYVTTAPGKDDKAQVLSYDEDPETFAKGVPAFGEALRRPDGILDKLRIPKLVDVVSPALDGLKEEALNVAVPLVGSAGMIGLAIAGSKRKAV